MNAKWIKVKQKLESKSVIKHVNIVPNKMHELRAIKCDRGREAHFAKEVERL